VVEGIGARGRGGAALLGGALVYGTFGVLIREMAPMFGDNAQVAFRFTLAFAFLGVYVLVRRRSTPVAAGPSVRAAVLGVVFTASVLLFTVSVNLTKIANSVFLLYAASMLTSLLVGTLVLEERLGVAKVVAIVLALAGLSMYASALVSVSLGVVTGLLSGMLDGLANALRKTLQGVDRTAVLLRQYAAGAAFGVVVTLFAGGDRIRVVSVLPVLAGVAFALAAILLGNLLLYGFQHFDVNVGTVILATELVFAALCGWIFFGELPTRSEAIGGALIFAGAAVSALDLGSLLTRRPTAPVT
jgi:S-adenosylmethionine uptake transporter